MTRTPVFFLHCAFPALAQTAPPATPFADFEARIAAYMQIHKQAERAMGKLKPSPSPGKLLETTQAMAEGIRARRAGVAQGDQFTPAIAREFRRLIAQDVRTRPRIRQSIRSGEEAAPKLQVNGSYPVGVPLETMPPTLLMAFPVLPAELAYRFVGAALVLRDVSANLIIDILPDAISNP